MNSIKVLGCLVNDFSASIGWANTETTVTLKLVEDPKDVTANAFTRPDPGTPVYINIGNLNFGGIVQRWSQIHSSEGNPIYKVDLVDPRNLLSGTQVIVSEYEGSTLGIPNFINAYGAYPWGQSGANDAGMPWLNIKPILEISTLRLGIHNFKLDLSYLPIMPLNYRIPGVVVSVFDIIAQICDESANDFFITLENRNNENYIVVKTSPLNRVVSVSNKIQEFLNNNADIKSEWSFGRELRDETVSTVLIGSDVQELYTSNNLHQFWGFIGDRPIISNYEFAIDITNLNIDILGSIYETNIDEMRAVLGGPDIWEAYIALTNQNRAIALGINDSTIWEIRNLLNISDPEDLNLRAIKRFSKKRAQIIVDYYNFAQDNFGELRERLYNFLKNFAENYYGKKFIVQIPNARKFLDAQTNEYIYDVEVVDSGWKESYGFGQDPLGISDQNESFFKVADGKFIPFVKVDNSNIIDIAQLQPDSFILDGTSIYIKCDVDPNIIQYQNLYENIYGYVNPKNGVIPGQIISAVIVTLPGVLGTILRDDSTDPVTFEFPPEYGFFNLMYNALILDGKTPAEARVRLQKLLPDLILTNFPFPAGPTLLVPNAVAIPLRSKTQVYGPWYSYQPNVAGRVEFLIDDSLNPWTYGSVSTMNIAGNDRVLRASTGLLIVETGTIITAGLPLKNLGDILIEEGPIVTGIDITVGLTGVTTFHRLQTYTPRFGDFGRQRTESLKKLGYRLNAIYASLKQIGTPPLDYLKATFPVKTLKTGTPFNEISVTKFPSLDALVGRTGSNYVAFNTMDTLISKSNAGIINEYIKTAGMNINGIFRAFSTKTNDTYFPHFITPDNSQTPNVNNLNPFKTGTDIISLSGSGEYANGNLDTDYDANNVRGISLRGPLIIAGWGYDTDGYPVPNASDSYPNMPSNVFKNDYLTNTIGWKCGPLDARWDERRGVWVAGGSNNDRLLCVVKENNLFYDGANGVTITPNGNKPVYLCRLSNNFENDGLVRWDNTTASFGSGVTDLYVYNLHENLGDYHTIGIGSPIFVYRTNLTLNGQSLGYMSENIRTMIVRSQEPY